MLLIFNCDCRDFTRPDLPSGEQADVSASAAGPGSAAGIPDLTTAIASKLQCTSTPIVGCLIQIDISNKKSVRVTDK